MFLNLNVPYFSAAKYLYPAFPYFCLLAASLIVKSGWLHKEAQSRVSFHKLAFGLAAAASVILALAALAWNVYSTNLTSTLDYLQFRVEPSVDYGRPTQSIAPCAW